ncbi:MAG: hypothetical protein QOI70_952 [Microbacteriaceae bacterium]|nr:hypothetical protein [Microbacteriaceae bacterium]
MNDNQDRVAAIQQEWARERPELDVRPLGVIGRLHRIAATLTSELTAVYRRFGLGEGDFDVLAALRRAGAPFERAPGELAEHTMVTTGAMTKRIDRLVASGLVSRRASEADARRRVVALTAEGRDLIDRAFGEHMANERRLLGGLSEPEREALEALLVKWTRSIMPGTIEILRYAAFASEPTGGNPAGVVLMADGLSDSAMQSIAAAVGYSETAFVTRRAIGGDPRRHGLRYFSPTDEVPFCGHATLATGFALAERHGVGEFTFETPIGIVVIETANTDTPNGAQITTAFTSVEPELKDFPSGVLDSLLDLLGIGRDDLSSEYPPRLAYAGNWHPILVLNDKNLFDTYHFEPAPLRELMRQQGWKGTVTTMFRLSSTEFEARNPFPVGAITEDPGTGSAAASFGGYLRALSMIDTPCQVTIHQGRHVGRESVLTVTVPPVGGIQVSGTVVAITES